MTPAAPYQVVGCDFLASHRHALLADEMRVRKTRQAIMAAHKIGAQSMLVVCPAIAVKHWEREVDRWWPSGPLPRLAVWSYDRARAKWQDGLRGNVDVFVPDECHFARNPAAARTAMVYGKTGFAYRAGNTWALSGTPMPGHPGELWPMMKAFGIVGLTYDEHCRRYCTINWATGKPNGTKKETVPELTALLNKFMLRRTRKEVAPDMPDIAFNFLEIDVADNGKLSAGSMTDEELMRAAQLDTEDRVGVALAKAEVLAEEIETAIDNGLLKQTVVFAWHKAPLKQLAADLHEAGISVAVLNGETPPKDREEIQERFKRGTLQVVLANIIAAGTAIDLSSAEHGYFLELWWRGSDNAQAANRLISLDKSTGVTFDVCVAPGTVDERVQGVLLRIMEGARAMGLA